MHLKILRLSGGLTWPNLRLGRGEAALQLFMKQLPPKGFYRRVHSDTRNLHHLKPMNPCFTAGTTVMV
jgi:hypothetical protein